MKKILAAVPLLMMVACLFSFRNGGKATYTVQPGKSGITWEGKKVIGGHNGTIGLKEGAVTCEDGRITGGSFKIDMSTIHDIDLEAPAREKLEHHLM